MIFLAAAPLRDVLEQVDALVPDGDELTGGTTVRTHGTVQRLASRYL